MEFSTGKRSPTGNQIFSMNDATLNRILSTNISHEVIYYIMVGHSYHSYRSRFSMQYSAIYFPFFFG
uniref:Ovule protein n=1 Tax=Ascaris lumbricoides TaxID=6252 RepID=A0A0M3IU38_ASCLU